MGLETKVTVDVKHWPFTVVEKLRKLDKYIQMPFVRKQCVIDVANKVMECILINGIVICKEPLLSVVQVAIN